MSKAVETAKSASEATKSALTKPVSDTSPQLAAPLLHNPYVRTLLPFINGGFAGMAATATIQPIDMVKVRLQLAGEGSRTTAGQSRASPLSVTRDIIAKGKIGDLYTGLSAGILRQAVYTTARMGFFDTFMTAARTRKEASVGGGAIGFKERAGAGLLAGGLAACVGNPADLALIRMQSDGLKAKELRANYTSVIDALTRITKSEGILALWSGASPTIVRAMALNFGQLAFFSEAKNQLKTRAPGLGGMQQTLCASAVAGFFASFFSLPFDFVKTRLQKQQRGGSGEGYRGMTDCFRKVARDEGLLRFYRGFGTYYVRIAPHAMITLIVADWLGVLTK